MARKMRLAAAGIELSPKKQPLVTKADLKRRERQLKFLLTQRDYKPPKGTSLIVEARRRCKQEVREMKEQRSKRQGQAKQAFNRVATNAVPRRLGTAGGFSRRPPGGGGGGEGRTKSADRTPPLGLTATFNAAAKKPTLRRPLSINDIKKLERLLSQPAMSPAPSPLGRATGSYDPKRDRNIQKQINSIRTAISKRQGIARQSFSKSAIQGTAKQAFNNAVRRKP